MEGKKLGLLVAFTLIFSYVSGHQMNAEEGEKPKQEVSVKKKKRPRMDIAFCIDTTASMQGEINIVKKKVKELVAKLASGKPAPDVRVALVAFRDRGDKYVTKEYEFTDDIDQFVKDINELKAQGGGDSPESVNEALHVAVNNLSWDKSNKTAKMMFLIGDAGPAKYHEDYDWAQESKKAIAKGIQINTIGCDGLESFAEADGIGVFKQIAKLAEGKFELLAYKQTITKRNGVRATVLRTGGESFEVDDSAVRDWKEGASKLVAAGKAKKVKARTRGVGYARETFSSMAGAPAAMPAAATLVPVDRNKNNLDSILIRAAQKKAEKTLDIKYDK